MNRREFNRLVGAMAVAPVLRAPRVPDGRRWSLVADIAECCSCAIPCSCNFGRPEAGTCHGTRLIQIRQGDLEGRDLSGIRFIVSFHMGQWTRIYIDDSLSAAQSAALDALLPVAFAGFDRLARARVRAPLRVTEGQGTFAFGVPESSIEMRLLPGLGGAPIRIENLPNPAYHEYVQYESVVHTHRSADASWSYAGTNGFRSVMRVSG
jgi:hypothetical protein